MPQVAGSGTAGMVTSEEEKESVPAKEAVPPVVPRTLNVLRPGKRR